jgi:hypothetical protein
MGPPCIIPVAITGSLPAEDGRRPATPNEARNMLGL